MHYAIEGLRDLLVELEQAQQRQEAEAKCYHELFPQWHDANGKYISDFA